MANSNKFIFVTVFLLFFAFNLEAKAKISRIDESNFEKFTNDGSYWIMQISKSPCPECESQEK